MKKFFIENSQVIFIVTEVNLFSIILFRLLNTKDITLEHIFLMVLNLICIVSLVFFIQKKKIE